jgi:hypothetical protein
VEDDKDRDLFRFLTFYLPYLKQITNSKHRITNKSQIPIFNDQKLPGPDIVWIFEFWSRAAQALAPRVGFF